MRLMPVPRCAPAVRCPAGTANEVHLRFTPLHG